MKCPACATELALAKLHLVEIDRCRGCGGVVLDKGEVIEGGVVECDRCDGCERLFFDQGELTALAAVATE
ncbi:MAG: zf-TFIIB domain-containing protein [Kofleriaceae bacterium]